VNRQSNTISLEGIALPLQTLARDRGGDWRQGAFMWREVLDGGKLKVISKFLASESLDVAISVSFAVSYHQPLFSFFGRDRLVQYFQ